MNREIILEFVAMSAELCGFKKFTLLGTGYAEGYYATIVGVVGQATMDRMLKIHAGLPPANAPAVRDLALRADLLSDPELGAIARNIIKLWYTATWFQLPRSWRDVYGTLANDQTFLPYTYAYPESLLGPAVGAHPQGAKAQGYASWAEPPQPVDFTGDLRL